MQEHLERIYALQCPERARTFLVDAETARALGGPAEASEELLVGEGAEGLELALYLAPDVLHALGPSPDCTPGARLDAFCKVTEGVSHFLYLVQTSGADRRLSLLELEAQAEVDKFASCLLRRGPGGSRAFGAALHRRLFDEVRLRPGLSPEERWRYAEANRLARSFCLRLLSHWAARRFDRLLTDLRYAYRLGAEAKLRHLAAAA